MNAKEYLNQARELEHTISVEIDRIRCMEEMANKATSINSDLPGSPTRDNTSRERILAKVNDLKNEVNTLIKNLDELKEDINDKIWNLSRTEYIEVLSYRYIQNMNWDEIAKAINLSAGYTFKLHAQALKEMDQILSVISTR